MIGGAIATYGNPVDHVDPGDGLHRPLAKRLTTLHILSGGRVIAGLGLGWSKDEYDHMDTPFTQRGARMTDFVRALKACWLPDPVEYHGDFFDVPKCDNSPEPIRRNAAGEPQIEVAMGGGGNANGDEGKGSASEPLNGAVRGCSKSRASSGELSCWHEPIRDAA